MSYALVAELPPIYGLYSALIPLALYCVRCHHRTPASLLHALPPCCAYKLLLTLGECNTTHDSSLVHRLSCRWVQPRWFHFSYPKRLVP
jgi:hypothetical protein